MTQAPLKLGLLGLGTVGQGVLTLLARNQADIAARLGREVVVTTASVRDLSKARMHAENVRLTTDSLDVVNADDVDIVVELIGGLDPAEDLVRAALAAGKPVVTANKALIARCGTALFPQADDANVALAYEASVAGGIPIIKAIREGLTANRIESVAGIINGTCNYILTRMANEGAAFAEVLKDAQDLGYAEADPSFDIDGIDAAHKLTILASLAFGIPLSFDAIHCEGVGLVTVEDLAYADELGYTIKHLGIAKRQASGVELRVHPTLVPRGEMLAGVNGVLNAVLVNADAASPTGYFGPGAGAEATASAVLADVIDVARGLSVPGLGRTQGGVDVPAVLSIDDAVSAHYLRLQVADVSGVLNAISGVLAQADISIEAISQKETPDPKADTQVVILTTPVSDARMAAAVSQIEALDSVHGKATRIRVEHFES